MSDTNGANNQSAEQQANASQGLWARLKAKFTHAFEVEPFDESSLSEEDKSVLQRLADRLHHKRMTPAAILWAHSHRHLNFIGSSAMIFAQPFFEMTHPMVNVVLEKFGAEIPPEDYPALATALEKRYSIEYFVQQLEAHANEDYNSRLAQKSSQDKPADQAEKPDTDGPNG